MPDETTATREADGSLGDQKDAVPPYASLLMCFSARLEDQMRPEHRAEFARRRYLWNVDGDEGIFRWLETSFSNYKVIVTDEHDK